MPEKVVYRTFEVNKDSTKDLDREHYQMGYRWVVYKQTDYLNSYLPFKLDRMGYFKTRGEADEFVEKIKKPEFQYGRTYGSKFPAESFKESERLGLEVDGWRKVAGTIDVDAWLKDDHIVLVERSRDVFGWVATHGTKERGTIPISTRGAVPRDEARRQAIDWMKANPTISQEAKRKPTASTNMSKESHML